MYPPVTQFETRALRLAPGPEEPLRIVVASVLRRAGIVRLLEASGFDVAGQAGDRDELLREVRAHRPDVAIVDLRIPPTHTDEGLRAARAIRAELPRTGVLVLSTHLEEGPRDPGVGYLLMDRVDERKRFTDAIHRVARGDTVLDPSFTKRRLPRVERARRRGLAALRAG